MCTQACTIRESSPICLLVLPTNKSPDLMYPGTFPMTVNNGNCATASFLPSETIAIAICGL